jgi:hypothetical protein
MFNDAPIHEFHMHRLTNVFNYVSFQILEALKERLRNLGCKALTRSSMSQSAKGILRGIYIEDSRALVVSRSDFTAC